MPTFLYVPRFYWVQRVPVNGCTLKRASSHHVHGESSWVSSWMQPCQPQPAAESLSSLLRSRGTLTCSIRIRCAHPMCKACLPRRSRPLYALDYIDFLPGQRPLPGLVAQQLAGLAPLVLIATRSHFQSHRGTFRPSPLSFCVRSGLSAGPEAQHLGSSPSVGSNARGRSSVWSQRWLASSIVKKESK